ncbi:unnamed protein product [Lota lota]
MQWYRTTQPFAWNTEDHGEVFQRTRDMGTSGLRVDTSRSCHLLLLLAASLSLPTAYGQLIEGSLKCLCDFNNTISCDWDSSLSAQHSNITAATSCKLCTYKETFYRDSYNFKSECDLRPHPTHPALRACSLVSPSPTREVFHHADTWIIDLVCESVNTSINIKYKPAYHIKLKPPRRPEVNLTIVTLFSEVPRLTKVGMRYIELQWKQEDRPWENGTLKKQTDPCKPLCQVKLTGLVQGRRYQARSRVRPQEIAYRSVWSDWSPVLTWVSSIGMEETQVNPAWHEVYMQWEALVTAVVGAVVILSLAIIICKTDRDTWVYMAKKIRGPPLPNLDKFLWPDGKSQVRLKIGFTNESQHTVTGQDVISSVEVINRWSAPHVQNLKASSSYSNPSYSPLLHVRALSSLPTPPQGNLEPCSADSPYGPVGGGAVGEEAMGESEENQGEDGEGRAPWGLDLLNMISGAHIGTAGSMTVCQDYEKVGNIGAQGSLELNSPDSGVGCSEEEERDSRDGFRDGREGGGSATDDGSQGSESPEEEGEESQIEMLLSKGVARGAIIGQGSLEVCLDYEKVVSLEVCLDYEKFKLLEGHKCRAQSPDSGVGSGGEEQVSEESLEEVDLSLGTKTFIFPTLSDTELRLQSSPIQSSSFFPGQGTSSSFSFSSEDGASMTNTSTLLPSSGGYMLL